VCVASTSSLREVRVSGLGGVVALFGL